jgi:HK97 family phage portal protein
MNLKQTLQHLRAAFGLATKQSELDQAFLRGDYDEPHRGGASLTSAYQQSVWVYSCIHALGSNVAQIPFRFSRGRRKGEDLIASGPLVTLFDRPHPQLNRFAFWELYVSWLCLRGEVFVVPVQVSRHERRLLVLPPDNFQHVISNHELAGWRYTGLGPEAPLESQVFLPDEVIHDRLPNPFNPWRGLSPLTVAMLAAETDFASAQFMKGMMLNNADIGLIACMDEQLAPEQREQLLAALRARKRKAGSADRPLLLWGKVRIERAAPTSVEMQFLENRKFNRQEICSVFGVPQELLGFTEDANRSVSDNARLNFIENRIAPLCERIAAALDPEIKRFGPAIHGFFDIDSLPIMQTARRSRTETAQKLFQMGVPFNDINHALDLGFPNYTWGNTGYIPRNLVPVTSPK